MIDIRRALAWAASDKYLTLVINFGFIAVMSRVLTPHEIGLSAIGVAVFGVADSLRDFGATTYLIQRRVVTLEALRTTFTMLFLSCLALGALLFASAPAIGTFYSEPQLTQYLQVLAAGFLAGPVAGPLLALIRRDMEFGRLAAINVASTLANAVIAISLALAGFSYMSFAWAGLASAVLTAAMALAFRPEFQIYRFRLHDWSDAVAFGSFATLTALLNRAYEALPLLILGRILAFDAVGLFQRATVICQLPDRIVLAAISPVALPAFAATARNDGDLKQSYLRAIEYVTAVQWPALLLLSLVAYPVVRVLLGPQWIAAAPLVQIMAIASLVMFPAILTYPVLVATGRIQDTMWSSLISLPLSLVALIPASFIGLEAIALSLFVTLPVQVYVALSFIRRQIPFTWAELGASVGKSAFATGCCAIGPLAILAAMGFRFDMPLPAAIAIGISAAPGWLAGLWLTSHPLMALLDECWHVVRCSRLGLSLRGPGPSPR